MRLGKTKGPEGVPEEKGISLCEVVLKNGDREATNGYFYCETSDVQRREISLQPPGL